MTLEVAQELGRVAAGLVEPVGRQQRTACIPGGDRVERAEQQVGIRHAEHGEDVVEGDRRSRVRDELLERPERVAERAGRVAGDERDGLAADLDALGRSHPPHDAGHLLRRRALEVEAMAAVDDRRQDLVRLGRREHEDRVRRRLLERLEERVPGLRREHVRLVEDVDLVAPGDRRVGDALAQVADVVDRVVRRRVHLDDVHRRRVRDRDARLAAPARRGRRPRPTLTRFACLRGARAVQAGGQDLGHRRLAGPARADEQVGVVHLALGDRVGQGAHDVLLADDVGEGAWAMATVQRRGRGHGGRASLVPGAVAASGRGRDRRYRAARWLDCARQG